MNTTTTWSVSAALALALSTLAAAADPAPPLVGRAPASPLAGDDVDDDHEDHARKPRASEAGQEPLLAQLERAFAAAADKVAPSVVTLKVERDPNAPPPKVAPLPVDTGEDPDPPYNHRPGGDVSGVAIARDRVLTSWYNLDGAKAIVVVDPTTGTRYRAKLLGRDENLDVALLGVGAPVAEGATESTAPSGAPDLRPAKLLDRPAPRVGSWLVAVGRGPSGELGINSGIVSALTRFRGDAIQTDAALNFGNYGGAAVDVEGRLVGLPVRLSARAGVNSGVGFVIPAQKLLAALPDLEAGRSRKAPPRAFLGVQFGAEELEPPGVAIARVVPGSAAEQAGLERGDILRRVAEADVQDAGSIADAIQGKQPGDMIHIEVDRGGKRIGFEVTLGTRPEEAR